MSDAKLIPLSMWAKRRYEKPPHIKTLLRWAREAKIVPVPKKEGRGYVVSEKARYIDYNDPNYAAVIAEALDESAETQRG